ncbi:HNH endonuclease [Serratia sp. N21D137]|uniref:HNH endonuclease n=1 Tax=Serratia sp. N21D137 TaxID=3397495 RepID=UPI0039E04368
MITQIEIMEKLNFDEETGVFTWKVKPSRRVVIGSVAGTKDTDGYRKIKVCGKVIPSHRLAWLYVYGGLPKQEIDHINRVRDDNRIINLRLATRSQNAKNKLKSSANTSGFKGVSAISTRGKWVAHIRVDGKNKHIGYYNTPERASIAYRIAAHFYHGNFNPIQF